MHTFKSARFLAAFTAGLLLLLGSGCGKKTGGPGGTVSGKITFKSTAIPEGCVVAFTKAEGGVAATGTVDASGNFKLYYKGDTDIPVGKYKVSITPPMVNETPEEAMRRMERKEKPKEYKEIPEKYRNITTSGETFEVKEGENTYNLDMTDGKK